MLDACSRAKVEFNPKVGSDHVSHLIEDEAITKALYGKILDDCPNVTFRTNVRVKECILPENTSSPARLALLDGSEVESLLVVSYLLI